MGGGSVDGAHAAGASGWATAYRVVKRYREALAGGLLLILGLATRLVFVSRFPALPVSDTHGLVMFGLYLRDHGLISHVWYWEQFNPALPLILCGLFHIFPHIDSGAVARVATACWCGLMPVAPLVIWRGVLPGWVRLLSGAALALWPGQILFSGVVAQDNWVILPTVALGALAVRALLSSEPPRVVVAGVLYAAGAAFRQEMLVVLLPLFLAVGLGRKRTSVLPVLPEGGKKGTEKRSSVLPGGKETGDKRRSSVPLGRRETGDRRRSSVPPGGRETGDRRRSSVLLALLAAGVPLVGLAAYRGAATGRFALTTQHTGVTILGSYVPGAGNGWIHPAPFLASVRPDLLRDREAYFAQTGGLALREALGRPAFHLARMVSSVASAAVAGEAVSMDWSLEAAEVLPARLHERGAALAGSLKWPLRWELVGIHGLFLAALIVGVRRRNPAIAVLGSTVLLKYGFHAVTVVFGRFFFVATALEILTIALAVHEIQSVVFAGRRRLVVRALATGAVAGLGLLVLAPRLAALVKSLDVDDLQRTYRFQLETPDHGAALRCVMDRGLLAALDWNRSATFRTRLSDPRPGDQAAAECELSGRGEAGPVVLQVLDSYPRGSVGGRMMQRVELDGAEAYAHDIGQAPGTGWANIPLGSVGMGVKRKVEIEVKAIRPEAGWAWGDVAQTTFQLAEDRGTLNLAMSKPVAQSSTLTGYDSTGADAAVDGNTDGNLFHGSVTATNLDGNAWWEVDLGASAPVGSVVIWNRTDCCGERLSDYWVFVSEGPFGAKDTPAALEGRVGTWSRHQTGEARASVRIEAGGAKGRYVRVQLGGAGYLSLAEVQVFGR